MNEKSSRGSPSDSQCINETIEMRGENFLIRYFTIIIYSNFDMYSVSQEKEKEGKRERDFAWNSIYGYQRIIN